jgi:hypothetical protein
MGVEKPGSGLLEVLKAPHAFVFSVKGGILPMKRAFIIIAVCLSLILPAVVQGAVFNMARDYIPAPPGTFATLLYYKHISADNAFARGKKVSNDVGLSGNVGLFRPVYWLEAGPLIIDPQFIIPFGGLSIDSGSGLNSFNTSSSGFGDSYWFATFWFLHNNKTKTYIGFTPIFIAPTGTYTRSKALNLGSNRWSFDEQLGIVQGVEVIPGHNLYGEIQFHGQFYTNNNDFTSAGLTLSTAPEFDLEAHVSYDITKAMWASLDFYGVWGAQNKVNGLSQHDALSTQTIGGTLAYSFAPGYQLALQYTGDVGVRSGTQNNTVMVRFLWATDLKGLMSSVKK